MSSRGTSWCCSLSSPSLRTQPGSAEPFIKAVAGRQSVGRADPSGGAARTCTDKLAVQSRTAFTLAATLR